MPHAYRWASASAEVQLCVCSLMMHNNAISNAWGFYRILAMPSGVACAKCASANSMPRH